MAILLPSEPIILCHFDYNSDRNHFKGQKVDKSLQIGSDTSVKKFGMASRILTTDNWLDFDEIGLDNSKDFTLSFWKYTRGIVHNLNENGASTICSGGGLGVKTFYINSSNYYTIELQRTTGAWIEFGNLWAASSDINQWVHVELSIETSTKIFRVFRNGINKISYTLPDLSISGYLNSSKLNLRDNANIQEALVIQSCLHTTNFTPPTEPYIWLDKNILAEDKDKYLYGYK